MGGWHQKLRSGFLRIVLYCIIGLHTSYKLQHTHLAIERIQWFPALRNRTLYRLYPSSMISLQPVHECRGGGVGRGCALNLVPFGVWLIAIHAKHSAHPPPLKLRPALQLFSATITTAFEAVCTGFVEALGPAQCLCAAVVSTFRSAGLFAVAGA